jgi:hypothetical protein
MSLQRAPSILPFSQEEIKDFSEKSKQPRSFLETFGPSDLLAIIQNYDFDFVLTQYKQVFKPGTNEIDLLRSPIISDIPGDITTKTQIQLLTAVSDGIEEFKTHNFRDSAIEPGAKASAQCKFIYDRIPAGKPVNCWLCGFQLNYDPKVSGPSRRSSVQCEHILPAAAALIFHGIIDEAADVDPRGSAGSSYDDREDRGDREFYQMNYDLAHAECNYPKKDTLLFVSPFYSDHGIVDTPPINEPLIKNFINSLLQPLKNGQTSLVRDFLMASQQPVEAWKAQQLTNIKTRLQPLVENLQAGSKLWLLGGVDKLLKNIDYMYAKYAIKDGIIFPMSRRLKTGEPEWYQQRVRSKKDYNDFIDLAYAKQAFPHLGVGTGGKRKRTRRIKKNGKFSTSRRRLRTKNGNRKNSRSNRKK